MMLTGCGEGSNADQQANSVVQQAESPDTQAEIQTEPQEKVKITYWHTYGDAEEPFFLDTVIPLFEQKYPNIEVEPMRQEVDQFNQLIVTSLGTHQTPDIARVDITNVAAYANQDALVSLDDMDGFGELKDTFLEAPLSTNFLKGKYYGIPLDTNCKAAIINMNFAKKLGLNEAPQTMEEIISAADAKGNGKYSISIGSTGDWDTYPLFWMFGGVLTDKDFTKATGYMDSEQSIAALQKIADLHNKKIITFNNIDGTAGAWDVMTKDGYLMTLDGPWFFAIFSDWKDKALVPAPVPAFNGKSASVVGGEDLVIFKDSKYPKEAYEFAKFLTSEEAQMLMASKGQMPVLKSAINKEQIKRDPVLSVYQKQLETANVRIPSPQNSTIGQIWSNMMTSVLKGEISAQDGLKKAATQVDAELAK